MCHCLRDNCDGDGLAVLRALPFNLSSVTLSLFLFFFSVCGWMVGKYEKLVSFVCDEILCFLESKTHYTQTQYWFPEVQ